MGTSFQLLGGGSEALNQTLNPCCPLLLRGVK